MLSHALKRWMSFTLWLLLTFVSWAVDLSVMTWNINRAVGANNPNSANQPYVAKIANHLKPDIWILHEVGGNTSGWNVTNQRNALITFVNTNLNYFGASPIVNRDYYIYVNTRSDGWISSAIISRYSFTEVNDVSMGAPNRGFTMATINVPGTNGVGVFGAHFKAGGYVEDAQKRQTNAEMSRNAVNQWRRQHRQSAYLYGADFNDNEDPDLNSIYDIGEALPDGRIYQPISTVRSTRLLDTQPLDAMGGKRTYKISSRNSDLRSRFDQLLYSAPEQGRDQINVVSSLLFNTRRFPAGQLPIGFEITDSENASDHAPVFARFRIRTNLRGGFGDAGDAVPEPSTLVQLLIMAGGSGFLFRLRLRIKQGTA